MTPRRSNLHGSLREFLTLNVGEIRRRRSRLSEETCGVHGSGGHHNSAGQVLHHGVQIATAEDL